MCPATRIASAILAYSFGGLLRSGDEGGEPSATGVTEGELLAAVVGPELDSLTAQAVLKDLREQCLFVHYDGAHYVFKTTPNVTGPRKTPEYQIDYLKNSKVPTLSPHLSVSLITLINSSGSTGFST